VWAEIQAMTWLELTTLGLLAIWNLCTYGFVWMAVTPTPRLSFGHAMVMTQSATAVTNTVPAVGSAIGVGMTYTMLGSWGYSRSKTTTAVLVSGVWNSFVKLGLPVLALALVLLQGGAGGGRITAAVAGIAALVVAIVVFVLLLRSQEMARRFGLLAGRVASRLLGLVRRPPVAGWELATTKFRARTLDLLERGWVPITVAQLVSHLSLYLVLLVALRVGRRDDLPGRQAGQGVRAAGPPADPAGGRAHPVRAGPRAGLCVGALGGGGGAGHRGQPVPWPAGPPGRLGAGRPGLRGPHLRRLAPAV
jgi:hypothetical protein